MDAYRNFKPPIFKQNDAFFVDETQATVCYSKSKSRRNFSAHLTKLVFTPRERLESNCNGRFGKKALDATRLIAIRNTIFKFYPCKQSTVILNGDKITSGDTDENIVWVRDCIPAIDESNRVLKKQLLAWLRKNRNGGVGGGGGGAAEAAKSASLSQTSSAATTFKDENNTSKREGFLTGNQDSINDLNEFDEDHEEFVEEEFDENE